MLRRYDALESGRKYQLWKWTNLMPPSSGLAPCCVTSRKTVHCQNGAGLRGQRVSRRYRGTDRGINTGRGTGGKMRGRNSTDGGRRELEEIRLNRNKVQGKKQQRQRWMCKWGPTAYGGKWTVSFTFCSSLPSGRYSRIPTEVKWELILFTFVKCVI